MHLRHALVLVVSLMAVIPVPAQDDPVRVDILTPDSSFAGPFTVLLHFTLEPEWHLYWKNPGDAGLSLAVRWSVPEGFTVSDAVYPTPERIVQGGIIAFGYTDELVVEYLITPPAGFSGTGTEEITADLDWLVCKESCIPGGRSLRLRLITPTHEGLSAAARLLSAARKEQPEPLEVIGLRVETARVHTAGSRTVATFTLNGAKGATITDFYPEPVEGFVLEHKDIVVRDGVVTVPMIPYDRSSTLNVLRGILVVDNRGYTVHVSLP